MTFLLLQHFTVIVNNLNCLESEIDFVAFNALFSLSNA